jgi:hypothetical protein
LPPQPLEHPAGATVDVVVLEAGEVGGPAFQPTASGRAHMLVEQRRLGEPDDVRVGLPAFEHLDSPDGRLQVTPVAVFDVAAHWPLSVRPA